VTFTCRSCRYSSANADGDLVCLLKRNYATKKCRAFEYEPGTDEGEKE
jgi:hypothetical protein